MQTPRAGQLLALLADLGVVVVERDRDKAERADAAVLNHERHHPTLTRSRNQSSTSVDVMAHASPCQRATCSRLNPW